MQNISEAGEGREGDRQGETDDQTIGRPRKGGP